jgi:DNA polymerase III psi subunit
MPKVQSPTTRMVNSRQQAYLDAMDIGVWRLRDTDLADIVNTENVPGLKLGPGGGGVLLVCANDTDSASRLANDISRALGSIPVWAWPLVDDAAVKMSVAIEENLFTTVAIFGHDLAAQFFGHELPDSLCSAKLLLLPAMQDIQSRAEARSTLWSTFCRAGMVSRN